MSRKYRQRGYQESDRDDRGPQRRPSAASSLSPEERIHRKGLRHAIDREAQEVIRCHQCGRNIQSFGSIGPSSACPHCTAPLHCCRVCRHFDSAARWQCRASIDEAVADKAAANRCSHYDPRLVLDTTGRRSQAQQGPGGGAREQFESLFKR